MSDAEPTTDEQIRMVAIRAAAESYPGHSYDYYIRVAKRFEDYIKTGSDSGR